MGMTASEAMADLALNEDMEAGFILCELVRPHFGQHIHYRCKEDVFF